MSEVRLVPLTEEQAEQLRNMADGAEMVNVPPYENAGVEGDIELLRAIADSYDESPA